MLFKVKGKIKFSPADKTNKHISESTWKRVAMIQTYCDLDQYYAWFLKKRFNIELNKNLRGTHVTFISDKLDESIFEEAAKIFDGKEIEFYIDNEPQTSGRYWWLRVYCPDAEIIRESMGLSRHPYFGLHLTLGHAVIKYPESVEESDNSSLKVKKDYLDSIFLILSIFSISKSSKLKS